MAQPSLDYLFVPLCSSGLVLNNPPMLPSRIPAPEFSTGMGNSSNWKLSREFGGRPTRHTPSAPAGVAVCYGVDPGTLCIDQLGKASSSGLSVRRVWPEPSAFIT